MPQIHVLDSETIDKIAAGEVVERPSSVVKELVENAIDAGADAVTVEIKDGGIEFIRVTDNGCGLEKEQIRKAFFRHATSKIENADDLFNIHSLGFRGEALSSIAAVAKVEMVTKTRDSLLGSRYILEGANEISLEDVGAPDGTTFLVRNLFYNTPVRRKFLKQPATEAGYIIELMEHLALSRPDISFKLMVGSQLKFHTSGNGDLKEVIYRIYGRDVASSLVPIQFDKEGIRIEGFLGKPVQVRSNRNYEIYFINGRFVRSIVVAKAIEEGYKEYLMQHKFPLCVLHITMEPGKIDVNVHPTKMDVRFTNTSIFASYLCGAIKLTLKSNEMIPDAYLSSDKELEKERKAEEIKLQTMKTPEPFEKQRSDSFRVLEEAKYETALPKKQEFFHNPVWARVKSTEDEDVIDIINKPKKEPTIEEEDFFTETSEVKEIEEVKEVKEGKLPVNEPAVQLNLFEEKILTVENRKKFRIIGQVFETYWMIEYNNELLIIDQHAAHEKVNYERLMKRFHEKSITSQNLMPPIIVSLTGKEEAVLKENLEVFEELGFLIEDFGGNEFALRGVPTDLYGCDEKEMFLEVLDQLSDGGNYGSIKVIEEKIASMSCKAAVKGNNVMKYEEAETLIDELLTLDNPYNCPHGRPTIITMSKVEMDKKFKRIVS